MCRTFSAFGLPNGDIYFNINLDSHNNIKDYFNIENEKRIGKIQPIEYYPNDVKDYVNLKKYNLHFDNDYREDWVTQIMIDKWVRKLTPLECRRFMGFPDDFNVQEISDTQQYKQAGNSMTVGVVKKILEKIYTQYAT